MESILSGRSSHKPRWMLDVYEDFYFQSTSRPDGGDFWSENPNISTNAANTRKFTYLPKLNILSLYLDWYQSLNLSEHSKGLADIFFSVIIWLDEDSPKIFQFFCWCEKISDSLGWWRGVVIECCVDDYNFNNCYQLRIRQEPGEW